ncbi:MAG TPA: acyl-CoA synthetase [Solimonas sp.]|nr:acyl-CoA synthetase [Solimonas sp.]
MSKLTDYTSYADAQRLYSMPAVWALFDGNPQSFNIAHECVDRHAADPARIAVRVAHADGHDEIIRFDELSRWSSRFAHWLLAQGVKPGDRVAFMLDPSLAFYMALFGAMKTGAISVPLFTLFGPEGLQLRVADCQPTILVTNPEKAEMARAAANTRVVVADDALFEALKPYPDTFKTTTTGDDIAAYQYTSGTTRELPAAVKHNHRSIVVLALAALYGTGVRPGDDFFCPSSPAWGHGMWHGTLAPLSLGVTTGTMSGKFAALRLLQALQDYGITNLSAAATHYRMMKATGAAEQFRFRLQKLSYTGEPIDTATLEFTEKLVGRPVCSMYGTTEIGVVLVNYPGAADFQVKPGSLGRAIPGQTVEVQDPNGKPCAPRQVGELKLLRRGQWVPTKDLGWIDEDGHFYHGGRADDVIISAGWTMSAVEIENVLLKHPDVQEAAVIGVKDQLRGQVVKAFVVSPRPRDDGFVRELQDFTRERLSQHEYPRVIAVVDELPKTPAGKVNRKVLRDRESVAAASS